MQNTLAIFCRRNRTHSHVFQSTRTVVSRNTRHASIQWKATVWAGTANMQKHGWVEWFWQKFDVFFFIATFGARHRNLTNPRIHASEEHRLAFFYLIQCWFDSLHDVNQIAETDDVILAIHGTAAWYRTGRRRMTLKFTRLSSDYFRWRSFSKVWVSFSPWFSRHPGRRCRSYDCSRLQRTNCPFLFVIVIKRLAFCRAHFAGHDFLPPRRPQAHCTASSICQMHGLTRYLLSTEGSGLLRHKRVSSLLAELCDIN